MKPNKEGAGADVRSLNECSASRKGVLKKHLYYVVLNIHPKPFRDREICYPDGHRIVGAGSPENSRARDPYLCHAWVHPAL